MRALSGAYLWIGVSKIAWDRKRLEMLFCFQIRGGLGVFLVLKFSVSCSMNDMSRGFFCLQEILLFQHFHVRYSIVMGTE